MNYKMKWCIKMAYLCRELQKLMPNPSKRHFITLIGNTGLMEHQYEALDWNLKIAEKNVHHFA